MSYFSCWKYPVVVMCLLLFLLSGATGLQAAEEQSVGQATGQEVEQQDAEQAAKNDDTPDPQLPPPFDYTLDPRTYGLDVDLYFGFPAQITGSWTQLYARLGAGWQREGYHRFSDGSLFITDDLETAQTANHRRLETGGRIGIFQGIGWNEQYQAPLFSAFALIGTSYDRHLQQSDYSPLIFATNYPDKAESLTTMLLTGVVYDTVVRQDRSLTGDYHEISVEYGPAWLGNRILGRAEFLRLHARSVLHRPLLTEGLYLVNGSYLDLLWGGWQADTMVPTNQRASIGGLQQRSGLGGTIRGFGAGRFDADIKAANAMDMRYQFPRLSPLHTDIGLIAYWDLGYYRRLRDAPPDAEHTAGWVSSNGFGLSATLNRSWTFVIYTHFPWFGPTAYEDQGMVPLALDFGFHQ
ncbi:hypothetical protein [Spirochaeta africana]|uniref:Bacterial surface antigen (D15) domain-containing protein n=1 Tax=Spirochaeta africana (strain ATCC 700263 / DSM 8902 / Z-7692) TaxID=889378 RepID=H9UJU3_SPIAZ|nr:hypothetical protein [Spirochaeta africana]AFG37786.1 hypothetical protein Spiaf_1729 [Spirochaeta africana DSM 8902]